MLKYKNILNLSKRSVRRRIDNKLRQKNLRKRKISSNRNTVEESAVANNECDESEHEIFPEREGSSDSYLEVDEDYCDVETSQFLRSWALEYNIKHNALTALIKYLRNKPGFEDLPGDSRSFLRTPKSREIIHMRPGHYVHIGIKQSLDKILSLIKDIPDVIVFDFNIDGLPISKSSTSGFWLILGRIYNLPETSIFVVGVYHGFYKPEKFSEFLVPFVEEMKQLNGNYIFRDKSIKINIRAFICDAPARCYITGTKSHNAYFGCNKCVQEGKYINFRMTFPENNAELRTNASFRQRLDENYHLYKSPLEDLDINMINQIPLDYLHTICIGVMKKFIGIWLSGDLPLRLQSKSIRTINERLVCIAKTQPLEFQRKIRPLSDFGYFKGSEFRTFLLYSGPVVLKYVIPSEQYNHFLLFHIASRLLCDEKYCQIYNTLANDMLKCFVEGVAEIYGEHHVIYNVHSLVHIAADVERFGHLDNFSSFPYESFMYSLKRLLHKNNQPLAQIYNRISEINCHNIVKYKDKRPQLKKATILTIDGTKRKIYKELFLYTFTLNCGIKNQWFITKKDNVMKFEYVILINDEIFICGQQVRKIENFFVHPLASTNLKIFQAKDQFLPKQLIKVDEVADKLFMMQCTNGNLVFMPLLHHN